MSTVLKGLLLAFVVIYAIFPDPIPGPIDDIILIVLYFTLNTKSKNKSIEA